jgi:hypothetical protein
LQKFLSVKKRGFWENKADSRSFEKQQTENSILRYGNRVIKTAENPRNPAIAISRL